MIEATGDVEAELEDVKEGWVEGDVDLLEELEAEFSAVAE